MQKTMAFVFAWIRRLQPNSQSAMHADAETNGRQRPIWIGWDQSASHLLAAVFFYAALAFTWLLYLPGLSGIFLFDDFPNLTPLETIKSNPTFDQIAQFFLHGISSPTGRPLSLATFAMQAFDWPGNPGAFLRVNLLLHLLNGALLFWWLLRLARLMQLSASPALWVPLTTTVLWLIAPIQVTAVIYVVQRMTELSACFVFLGLLLYLIGRESVLRGAHRGGLVWMSLAIILGGGLGVLAKENAALLPLLILAIEFTLLAKLPRPPFWRAWAMVFLAVPVAALVGYLLLKAGPFASGYAIREFSLSERLMTEARVLFMYLHKLLLPWPSAVRLLYDDYPVSRGLLQPWTTFISVVGVIGLIGAGWKLRQRAPLFAFAVLWFFGAHLLESSVIPLELVFEHRNYQAGVGVLFALVASIPYLWNRASARHVRITLAGLGAAYILLLSLVTLQITTLWGNPLLMADWWSQKLPDSKRAKIELLGTLLALRLPAQAVEVAQVASLRWPDDPSFHLVLLHVSCHHPEVLPPPITETVPRIRAMKSEIYTTIYLMDTVLTLIEQGSCTRVSPGVVRQLVEAAFDNPILLTQRRNLLLLYTRALKRENRVAEALDYFREAVELHPLMILLIQGVLYELEAGRLDKAQEYLRLAESDPRVSFLDRWSHRKDIVSLSKLLDLYVEKPATP